jgi:hypothetical protein
MPLRSKQAYSPRAIWLSTLGLVGLLNMPTLAWSCDDACKVKAAQSYIDALQSHDATNVPLADHVRRLENNKVNADGADALRQSLNKGAQYRLIRGIRDLSWYVAGADVFAIYTVDAGLSTGTLASGRTFERFRVENGLITQIEIVVYTSLGKVPAPEWPKQGPWP